MIDMRALDRLRQTLGDNPEDLVEMIVSFLEEAPLQLRQMGLAIAADDPVMLRRTAHSMKSNALDFGAHDLAELCRSLEEDLRAERDIGDRTARVARIWREWALIEPDLRRLVEGGLA